MMKIIRIEIFLVLLFSISNIFGQNLYRSYYPDSILSSQEIFIPSYENEFNKNVSFYYETWNQRDIISGMLLFESNDTLYFARRPSVFIENILPSYRNKEKEDKVAKMDFTINILTETIYFDSINRFSLGNGWGTAKYNFKKIKVEITDTTFLFKNREMAFNYCCMAKRESSYIIGNPKHLNVYYFFDHGKPIYQYSFFADDKRHDFNYMKLEFYNMDDKLKFINSLNNE